MDIPYAIQQVLAANTTVATLTSSAPGGGIYLLDLPETIDSVMPIQCVVIRGGGGVPTYGSGTLQLNDQRIHILSYGQTPHLAWNLDSAIYLVLKNLGPSVSAQTYLHWVKPVMRPVNLRDPDLQWPYVVSSWQSLASDITIAA